MAMATAAAVVAEGVEEGEGEAAAVVPEPAAAQSRSSRLVALIELLRKPVLLSCSYK
jgi:hypothetical protein